MHSKNCPDNRTSQEGTGRSLVESHLGRPRSIRRPARSSISAFFLVSFRGTCTYRLALPRSLFPRLYSSCNPRCRIGGRAAQKCAARRYARHGNCVEAGNDSVRTNGDAEGGDVKGTRRAGHPSLLIPSPQPPPRPRPAPLPTPRRPSPLVAQPCRPRDVPIFRKPGRT